MENKHNYYTQWISQAPHYRNTKAATGGAL